MEKKSEEMMLSSDEILFELRGEINILTSDDFIELVNCGNVLEIIQGIFDKTVILTHDRRIVIDHPMGNVTWYRKQSDGYWIKSRNDCNKPAFYCRYYDAYYYYDHEGKLVKSCV